MCCLFSSSHRSLAAESVTAVTREAVAKLACAFIATPHMRSWLWTAGGARAVASPANRAMCGYVLKGSSGDAANPFPVPSLPNGNAKPGKPQAKSDR